MLDNNQKTKGHFRKNWAFYSLLAIMLISIGTLWMTKRYSMKKQSKKFDTEKSIILEKAQKNLTDNSVEHLRLMMKTFVWAVRGEMTRGNQEQVDQYFKQLVKVEKIEEIILVDKEGKIILSTNKKNEGNKLGEPYPDDILTVEETAIVENEGKHIAAAPVMSIDSRIGTLILTYKSDLFQLEDETETEAVPTE